MKKIIAFLSLLIILCSSLTVFASGNTTININTAKIENATESAFVDINISENNGISAMTISITYDEALQYIGFKEGIFSDYSVKDYKDENYIRLVVLENEDIKEDGLLISLEFKITNAEKGKLYPVSIKYSEGDFCNALGEAISPKIISGGVALIAKDTASQTPSKYESSSASSQSSIVASQSTIESNSSSQSNETSLPSSSAISGDSQIGEENEEKKDTVQSEVTSSTVLEENSNYPKWIIIPIVLILIILVFYVILRKKK